MKIVRESLIENQNMGMPEIWKAWMERTYPEAKVRIREGQLSLMWSDEVNENWNVMVVFPDGKHVMLEYGPSPNGRYEVGKAYVNDSQEYQEFDDLQSLRNIIEGSLDEGFKQKYNDYWKRHLLKVMAEKHGWTKEDIDDFYAEYGDDTKFTGPVRLERKVRKDLLKQANASLQPGLKRRPVNNEGVADKYAAKKWGLQDPEDELERKFKAKKVADENEEVGKVKGKPLYKNPKDLKNMVPGARGVVMPNGDLYVVNDAFDVIHVDILDALSDKGIVKTGTRGWEIAPLDDFKFMTVQRVWNKPAFAIGESYMLPKPKKDPMGFEKAVKGFKPYLDAAKQRNPQYKFLPMQVRQAARQFLTPEEREEYLKQGS